MSPYSKTFKIFSVGAVCGIVLSGCLLGYRDLIYNPNALMHKIAQEQIKEYIAPQEQKSPQEQKFPKEQGIPQEQMLQKVVDYALNPKQLERDIVALQANFKKAVAILTQQIVRQWGNNNAPTASQSVYVKYTDSYLSRAQVDFDKGVISVETLDTNAPKVALKRAIVTTLLTPEDPEQVDLYSDREVVFRGKPYLAGLVKDNENQVVLYPWRANRYADYLIANALKTREITENGKNKKVYYVEFNMVQDHTIQSEHKYGEYVALYAREYNLEQALIFAIIKTESSFNPYAVSHIPAYGLMQVVPGSAGRDVYRSLNHRDGIPTKEMLFTPKTNIQYGSAYLDILFRRYIKGVNNALSQEYCVIAAYNTGSGNVLSVFHKDRAKAIQVINSMTSAEVYRKLRTSLKYEEARNYLHKVTTAKKDFQKSTASMQNTEENLNLTLL